MEPVNEQARLYSQTYTEALNSNQAETVRWSAYRQDHVDLKANLRMYQQSSKVDILIPVGTKALLPGQLYHTSEVMVSHGGGYFSDCTAEQAQSIADRRIKLADEMLQKYDRERSLYSDKLELPLMSEAFASEDGGREIIEPYDEAAENRWRVEHRQRVRESKQREAKERAAGDCSADKGSDGELFAKLEEAELLEELEQEMEQLELDAGEQVDDQTLGRLMRGELRLNGRPRVAHNVEKSAVVEKVPIIGNPTGAETKPPKPPVTVEEEEIETTDEDEDSEEDGDDDVSAAFTEILSETKDYSVEDTIKTFQAKLKGVRQRLYQNSLTLNEKLDLYQLYGELEEALDILQPPGVLGQIGTVAKEQTQPRRDVEKKVQFAETEQIKVIDSNPPDLWRDREESLKATKNTLFLPIVHSPGHGIAPPMPSSDEIVSPADIYRLFLAEQEEPPKKPTSPVGLKSILKNKLVNRTTGPRVAEQPRGLGSKPAWMDSWPDMLGEIVEHTTPSVVSDIPKSVTSSHDQPPQQEQQQQQPKKKVSRFKQQRQ
ncbi:unconventional prefoldin RPB5 interactor-like protein [Anopheles nili]|uniref:unconventional prefoldin RPB5 interactor-like protein n=1 Tax=Anopheles nili TaxID=185578 RepID=UPI00237C0010|nr:unconventional prefoldin RPB5 interactor-like protein [Anopheles nili]